MKILKNPIFMFILGVVLTTSIGVVAININANQINYTRNNETVKVDAALDDLYSKVDGSKYVALFYMSSSISSSNKKVPNAYLDSNYGYIDENGDLIFTKSGEYQILAKVGHTNTTNTTYTSIYLNNTLIPNQNYTPTYEENSRSNTYGDQILNKSLSISTNDKISINMRSDGDVAGIGSAMVVIVKK